MRKPLVLVGISSVLCFAAAFVCVFLERVRSLMIAVAAFRL